MTEQDALIASGKEKLKALLDSIKVERSNDFNTRYSGFDWVEPMQRMNTEIDIIGCGGIGSNLIMCMARTGFPELRIFDMDKVEPHNIGGQFYTVGDSYNSKVSSMVKNMSRFISSTRIYAEACKYRGDNVRCPSPYTIVATDNIESRLDAATNWVEKVYKKRIKSKVIKPFFMDLRMEAELYQIFFMDMDTPEDIIKTYIEAEMHTSDKLSNAPCNMKQTSYLGLNIGSIGTNIIVNHINNSVSDFTKTVPFFTEFDAQGLTITTKTAQEYYESNR